jgi:hypothetical protein
MQRRTNKGSNKRRGRSRKKINRGDVVAVPRSMGTAPRNELIWVRYSTTQNLTNATALGANVSFNLSQPTNLTGSANLISGFASYFSGSSSAGLYNAVRAEAFRVTISCSNKDATTCPRFAAAFTPNTVANNTLVTLANQAPYVGTQFGKKVQLGISTGMSSKTFRLGTNLKRLFGANAISNLDGYTWYISGATGSLVTPTSPVNLLLMLYSTTTLTSGCDFVIDIDTFCNFYLRSSPSS